MKSKKVTARFDVEVQDDFDFKEKAQRDQIIKDLVISGQYKNARVLTVENIK